MFGFLGSRNTTGIDSQALFDALNKSQAIIEFEVDGTIITANANFLKAMGYTLAEVAGKHHSMFVAADQKDSADYRQFWERLRNGEFQQAQFKRVGKGGKEVWIEASYNPVLNSSGRPFKVVKVATDITAQKAEYANLRGQIEAIHKSQAVIEFDLDGTILSANGNFLSVMGYTLEEIRGRHHSMFVEPGVKESAEYREFWADLRRGEYRAAQYKRIAKGGREVWIEASYNPIFDLNGKPVKVIKYATDITRQAQLLGELKYLIDHNFTEIESAIEQVELQAGSAAQASAATNQNVNTVAASAEELAASAREISDSMLRSKEATETAFGQAEAADRSAQRLTDVAAAMGGIVGLIRSIAGQINLLALNATIEAARAGEAGRGFAVVATEVKNLANQSADATAQITKEIEGMQAVSGEVVTALSAIRQAMDSVREFVTVTAGAVEEQSAVTRDMSNNMQEASGSVATVESSIGEIASAVSQVGQAVARTKQAAGVLAR